MPLIGVFQLALSLNFGKSLGSAVKMQQDSAQSALFVFGHFQPAVLVFPVILFLAVEQQDGVGVLFDLAGFFQAVQPRVSARRARQVCSAMETRATSSVRLRPWPETSWR